MSYVISRSFASICFTRASLSADISRYSQYSLHKIIVLNAPWDGLGASPVVATDQLISLKNFPLLPAHPVQGA